MPGILGGEVQNWRWGTGGWGWCFDDQTVCFFVIKFLLFINCRRRKYNISSTKIFDSQKDEKTEAPVRTEVKHTLAIRRPAVFVPCTLVVNQLHENKNIQKTFKIWKFCKSQAVSVSNSQTSVFKPSMQKSVNKIKYLTTDRTARSKLTHSVTRARPR